LKKRVREYDGESVKISYDPVRCIHVAECIRRLPGVFEKDRRPWVEANAASADEVAAMIPHCPTGALHFERLDGGTGEPSPAENTVTLEPDGPLYVAGRVTVKNAAGDVLYEDSRIALCRCGASAHKPVCDGRHGQLPFEDDGTLRTGLSASESEATSLEITVTQNGPLLVQGPFKLVDASGGATTSLAQAKLCRCGASANRPFCDGSHVAAGFEAE
jgi:CDGSH-type Zn-finger protein/uncharacterized Fe-S cluster protein YjdI